METNSPAQARKAGAHGKTRPIRKLQTIRGHAPVTDLKVTGPAWLFRRGVIA